MIVAIGIYIWCWGLFYRGSDDIWDYMAITGAIYFTGAFAVLMGGLYWKRASRVGAWAALLSGLTAVLGLGPVREVAARTLLELSGKPITEAALAETLTSSRVGLSTVGFSLAMLVVFSLLFPDRSTPQEKP